MPSGLAPCVKWSGGGSVLHRLAGFHDPIGGAGDPLEIGIAVDRSGTVHVVDQGNDQVVKRTRTPPELRVTTSPAVPQPLWKPLSAPRSKVSACACGMSALKKKARTGSCAF